MTTSCGLAMGTGSFQQTHQQPCQVQRAVIRGQVHVLKQAHQLFRIIRICLLINVSRKSWNRSLSSWSIPARVGGSSAWNWLVLSCAKGDLGPEVPRFSFFQFPFGVMPVFSASLLGCRIGLRFLFLASITPTGLRSTKQGYNPPAPHRSDIPGRQAPDQAQLMAVLSTTSWQERSSMVSMLYRAVCSGVLFILYLCRYLALHNLLAMERSGIDDPKLMRWLCGLFHFFLSTSRFYRSHLRRSNGFCTVNHYDIELVLLRNVFRVIFLGCLLNHILQADQNCCS